MITLSAGLLSAFLVCGASNGQAAELALAAQPAATLDENWNEWHLGPVGVLGEVEKGKSHFRIKQVTSGTAGAKAGLAVDDLIVGVGGKGFENTTFNMNDGGTGPLEALGYAIDKVEGTDGILELSILRGAETMEIEVELEVIGSFGESYPYDCRKSLRFLDQCCDWLAKANHGGHEATTALIGLALMSRGAAKYDAPIERIKNTLVRRAEKMQGTWNWNIGYSGIFLAEYYLKTKDKAILTAIEQMVAITEPRVMGTGSFGYGLLDKKQRARPCNSAGSTVLWFWAMALRCGVEVDPVRLDLAIGYLAACTIGRGDGGIRYNFSAGGADNASKTANTAIAFGLLGQARLQQYAEAEQHVINPAYVMGEDISKRARAAVLDRDLTGDQTKYLVKHLQRSRENHVTMSLGMLAVPAALAMHEDPNRLRAFMDYWKWFLRLSMGPDGEVYYHGNNQSHMGDRQLGQDRMGPVTMALIFGIGQQHLQCHGGFPTIDGVVYLELPKKLKAAFDDIKDKEYKSAMTALERELSRTRSEFKFQAGAMADHITGLADDELMQVEDLLDSSDIVLTEIRLAEYKELYGFLDIHADFAASLAIEMKAPENRLKNRRGKEYYGILDKHSEDPKRRHTQLKRFVAADVNGFYSSLPALKELREQVLAEQSASDRR